MIPMERYCWGKPSFSASVSLTLAIVWVASTLAGIKSPVIMSPPLFCRGGCPHPPAGWRRDGGAGRCGHRPLRSPAYLRSIPLAFFSSMVLISSAICAPAVPRAAGRTGPPSVSFICSGELNSPGIKVLPAGQNACTRNARPVEAGGRISPQINAAGLFLQHGLDQLRNVRARLHRGGTLAVDVGDHRALGLRYADVGLVGQVG